MHGFGGCNGERCDTSEDGFFDDVMLGMWPSWCGDNNGDKDGKEKEKNHEWKQKNVKEEGGGFNME